MRWVIQTNIFAEEGFDSLVATLARFALPTAYVEVIPFVGELELVEGELPPDGGRAIVMGSYSLAKVAARRRWVPGAFLDNLDFAVQRAHWGERMLNAGAHVCRFADVPEQPSPFFLRPLLDTKAFAGTLTDWPSYTAWRDAVRNVPADDPDLPPLLADVLTVDTPVMVCPRREIYSETRCWIVRGEVATCSGYKLGTRVRSSPPDQVDASVRAYAAACAAMWSPNEAYVLDIADTADGLKVIEVNNLNSAGWYKADLQKLVAALHDAFAALPS